MRDEPDPPIEPSPRGEPEAEAEDTEPQLSLLEGQ
jgi:hypothetical protein